MALRDLEPMMSDPKLQPLIVNFAPFVAYHQKGLWRFLRLIGCTPEEADDLTQDVFIAVFRAGIRDMGDSAAAAYLRTAARRAFIDLRQRQSRAAETADLDAAEAVWAGVAPDDSGESQLELLRDCLEQLAPRSQEAIRLFYGADAARRDVAKQLGIGEDGARNLLARARATLRECMEGKS